jgi:hypothetical protein
MDLTTIEMPKDEALQAFREYRDAVRERHDQELEQIMRGYRELARGRQLVNIVDVMRRGGQQENGMPNLAICLADERWCMVDASSHGRSITFIGFRDEARGWPGPHRSVKRRVRVAGFDKVPDWAVTRELAAMVPIVPPALRPAHHLRNFHVLWEAQWERRPRPPGDPALLKRIGGDLFAVVAVWELTELERAVLSARSE